MLFYWPLFSRSFTEACGKVRNLLSNLHEMAAGNWLNKKENLVELSYTAIRTLDAVRFPVIVCSLPSQIIFSILCFCFFLSSFRRRLVLELVFIFCSHMVVVGRFSSP